MGVQGVPIWDPRGVSLWDGPRPVVRRGRSRFGTGGSNIGTGCEMGCLGMVEVVAGGSLCAGIVELGPACDEACGFQFFERSHDGASPSTGFGHQCADRRVARKVFIGLVGEKVQNKLGGR